QLASRKLAGRIGEMIDTAPMIHVHGLKTRSEAEIGNRLGGLFDAILSVEQVGVFKPHHRVYDLVEKTFGCSRQEVLFVSSNGWDACCAAAYGFRTLWVNRRQEPVDRLPVRPNFVAESLVGLPRVIENL
ncbi:MAG: HAD-IA family hydrolase, partial [Pseudomonadota bacterium]